MRVYRGEFAQYLYRRQLKELLEEGEQVSVRGRTTREFLNVATVIERPDYRVILVPGRNWNPFLALSESLWLLAGRNDVASLLPYNHRITEFSDDGVTLHGAYGLRIRDQLPDLIDRLQRDPNDRRAVLSIWRPEDLTANTLDPPCNDIVFFKLREGRLHMTVINRSNDIHWGLYAVNLCQFSVLQEVVATQLGADLGTQTHFSNSLHVYEDHPAARAISQRMMNQLTLPLPLMPKPYPLFPLSLPLESVQRLCNEVLDGNTISYNSPFFGFALSFLALYRQCKRGYSVTEVENLPFAGYYPDWSRAALAFRKGVEE